MPYYCRYAPSLGALEGTPEEVWGTPPYDPRRHNREPTVFFGMYDLRDYVALAAHRGRAYVLWAGSDIRNLAAGFAFNDGKLRTLSRIFKGRFTRLVLAVLRRAEHWTENELERAALEEIGVPVAGVCPSFMGRTDLPASYRQCRRPNVYLSASEGRQEEYGFRIVESIAAALPWMRFHLYGASWTTRHRNVIVHGRIPKEQMNEEIKNFQIGLRLNEFDGFSEILAKAALMGQYAVGRVLHPKIPTFENDMELIATLNYLGKQTSLNYAARNWYRENLNKYPWNVCAT